MSEIDWSKAPEGAQYWRKSLERWYRVNGEYAYVFSAYNRRWGRSNEFNAKTIDESRDFVKHPSSPAWNGEGLPPVGTVCEYMWNYRDHGSEYVTARVIVHDNGKAVVRVISGEHQDRLGESNGGFCGDEPVWRPLRTPEQIAAEEREKAVDALCYEIIMHYGYPKNAEHYRSLAEKLHDAGYRKVDNT